MRLILSAVSLLLVLVAQARSDQGAYARLRMPIDYTEDSLNADLAVEGLPDDPSGTRRLSFATRAGLDIDYYAVSVTRERIVGLDTNVSVLSSGGDLGQGCGVPNDTFGFIELSGGFVGQAVSCEDFIGRYTVRGNPDVFPGSSWQILPQVSVTTDEGTMDTVFAGQQRMGVAASATWAVLPGLDLNVRAAAALCEISVDAIHCRRILRPPNGEDTIKAIGVADDDAGAGVYLGLRQGFGNVSDSIYRYPVSGLDDPVQILDQSDQPGGATEAVGPIQRAAFGAKGGVALSTGPDSGLQQLILAFDQELTRVIGAGEPVPGAPGAMFDNANPFGGLAVDGPRYGFDGNFRRTSEPRSKRGTFVLSLPISIGRSLAPTVPEVVAVILPGDSLEGGTVRNARLVDVVGDMVVSIVEYEEGGLDVYAAIPVPEPGALAAGLTALATLVALRVRLRRSRGTSPFQSSHAPSGARRA